jgi:D-alanyl-D-alanine carboxypeptidase
MSTPSPRSGFAARLASLGVVAAILVLTSAVAPVRAAGLLIDPIGDQTVAEGNSIDVAVHAANDGNSAISFGATASVPSFATLTDHGDGTATLHIAPGFADAGTGATVSFVATATDDLDGAITPVCQPASGATFPLSTTTVTCTATDAAGNSGSASFTVTVSDTTGPVITASGGGALPDLRVAATRPAGAEVTFTVVGSDVVDGALVPTCTPPSGAFFPVGTTTVTCRATDAAGNTASESFELTVTPYAGPPPDDPSDLDHGSRKPLGAQLHSAHPAARVRRVRDPGRGRAPVAPQEPKNPIGAEGGSLRILAMDLRTSGSPQSTDQEVRVRARHVALATLIALGAIGIITPLGSTIRAGSPPVCTYADTATRYPQLTDWYRTLVDTKFRLPGSSAPRDLVPISRSGAPGSGSIRQIVLGDLKAMFTAATRAGAPFAVASAYRSYSYQVGTFNRWVRRSGLAAAKLASARPGHSEHQLGTSMDLTSPARVVAGKAIGVGKGPWEYADWGTTAPGRWLRNNSWKYGFVMSYPKIGSPRKTCYKYEPWHFRYVGRRLAALIHGSGLTPREWLWAYGANGTWTGGPPSTTGGSGGAAPPPPPPPDDEPAPASLTAGEELVTEGALDLPATDTIAPAAHGADGQVSMPWALLALASFAGSILYQRRRLRAPALRD